MDKKVRVNIIDILIILILAAAVGIFGYFAMGKWEANNSKVAEKLEYTVLVSEIEEEFKDSFTIGDEVRDARKSENLGVIQSVSVENTKKNVWSAKDGKYVENVLDDKYDVAVTISSAYSDTPTGPCISDIELKIGKTITFRSENVAAKGVILGVNR